MIRTLAALFLAILFAADVAAAEPKGRRILAISVNEVPGADYASSFAAAREAGMQAVELTLNWDEIETAPGVYRPDPDLLAIAGQFYPQYGTRITLVINTIDTVADRRPQWLRSKRWNDPEVIDAYVRLVTWALAKARPLRLVSLAVGNEVDVYLGNSAPDWDAYTVFALKTRAAIRGSRPRLPVGVKITLPALTGAMASRALRLQRAMDAAMLNYYPLNEDFTVKAPSAASTDIARAVRQLRGKTLHFSEIGYPSSSACGSSSASQAEFVRQAFTAWDAHRNEIALMNFVWLNDIDREELVGYLQYYGNASRCFVQYLATLGLRRNGAAKPGFRALAEEAHARGW